MLGSSCPRFFIIQSYRHPYFVKHGRRRIFRMEESSMPHNGQSRMARRKQKQKISKKKPFWKKLLLYIAVVFLLAGIGVGGVFVYYIATAAQLHEDLFIDQYSSWFVVKAIH